MKKNRTLFWIITGIFALFMGLGAIPDILMMDEAISVAEHLGYPLYILPFLGVAKILGAVTILIPRFYTLKEWAYAGLSADLIGATYSNIQVDGFGSNVLIPFIGILLLTTSYLFWRRKIVKTYQEALTHNSKNQPNHA